MKNRSLGYQLSAISFKLLFSAIWLLSLGATARAVPVAFDIPAQPAPAALDLFIRQASVQVVYLKDEIAAVQTNAVNGTHEPRDALQLLLKDTGLVSSERKPGQFAVGRAKSAAATASVRGTLVGIEGRAIEGVRARLRETGQLAELGADGNFVFNEILPGAYTITVTAPGYQLLHITQVQVRSGSDVVLGRQWMRRLSPSDDVTNMEPYVVEAEIVAEMDPFEVTAGKTKPFTSRNVDLPRTVNDPQAYYMFDARDIDRAGVVNLEQFIKRSLPMQTTGNSADQSIFIGGTRGSVNLRGLGTNQTLILLNGRRVSGGNLALNGGFEGLDINTVPLGAVDRVEVLPSSASAIYGANAVGGVINIVLKRNYSGGEFKATYQNPDDTDAPIRKLDLNYGFSLEGGRTQVMLATGYSDQKLLQTRDRREFMDGYAWQIRQNTIAATGNPAQSWLGATPTIINSISTLPLTLKPAYGGGSIGSAITYIPYGITGTTPLATLGATLRANAGQVNRDVPDTRQIRNGLRADIGTAPRLTTFMATIRREMTPWLELNGEFSYTGDHSSRNMLAMTTQAVPATALWNPFTSSVNLTLPIAGEAPVSSHNTSRRITAGLLLKLPFDWIAQADYTWSGSNNAFYNPVNSLSLADITTDLNAGILNPFVDSTLIPWDMSRYTSRQTWSGKGTLNDIAARLAGPVGRLPGGAPSLAVGLERRQDGIKDGLRDTVFPNFPNRDNQTLALGKKTVVNSAYVEAKIPLVGKENRWRLIHDLDLQLAWRLEDFTVNTGTSSITVLPVPLTPPVIVANTATYKSSNPTAGLTYHPVSSLLLRASYSQGFVPPNYSQLAPSVQAPGLLNISDPRRGNMITPVLTAFGGNPDLQPETSDTISAGVVFEPESGSLKGLRLGVDYVYIKKENNISNLSAQFIVENEAFYPGRVTRGPVPVGDPFGVGPITLVDTGAVNLLRTFSESVDVSLRWRKSTNRLGNFDFNALATFGLSFIRQNTIGSPASDYLGYGSFPLKFTGNATLVWDYRRYSVGWSSRYVPRLHVIGPPVIAFLGSRQGQGGEWVPSQTYHDLFFSYRFPLVTQESGERRSWLKRSRLLSGLEVQIAVYNVFRHKPPLDNTTLTIYGYSTYGDLRLRDIRLSIKKPL
ncbi:MAG: TonB-dependent receptor [Opitutaceae bacterium]|nr:TonB-dependent receptor [Opitutaceae bacterium]